MYRITKEWGPEREIKLRRRAILQPSTLGPVIRLRIDLLQIIDEKARLRRQMPLLRIHSHDVVMGQGILVQHRDQLARGQLRLYLPGGTPCQPKSFAGPAVQ